MNKDEEMNKDSRILVLGATGMVGSAIVRKLDADGYTNVLGTSSKDLDCTNYQATEDFLVHSKIQYVFVAAAVVGGIKGNRDRPADFGTDNALIACNVLSAACYAERFAEIEKLLFLGSSCIYPRLAEQPMKEEALLTGKLEPTNEMYALAKILGLKLCDAYREQYGNDFISAMPCNLFGPHDNYHPENSHVVAALIRRFHEAKTKGDKSVQCWGTGSPMREFMHVDDLAEACVFLMNNHSYDGHVNVGTNKECSIHEFTEIVADVVGYEGEIEWGNPKDDGMPRKVMECSKIHEMGWHHKISLRDGLKNAYEWFVENKDILAER